jgi:FkbM family methyltransferase
LFPNFVRRYIHSFGYNHADLSIFSDLGGNVRRFAWPVLLAVVLVALALLLYPKRIQLIQDRIRGRIQVAHGCTVFSPGIFEDEERFEQTRGKVREIQRDGKIALYDTPIGSLWYRTGSWTLPALVEENQSDAYHFSTLVKRGDVVLDVGANVGTDTKSALAAGAGLVVAVEPEPLTLECLRRNLASEIRDERVAVVPKGAWDKEDTLLLHVDEANAGGSTFLWQTGGPSISVPLTTIDRIVAELNLQRVDVIKMDIEGSEKNALLGARETIRRFHPRLAIVLEHGVSDTDVLPAVARSLWPGYHVTLTDCTKTMTLIHPETALLTP